MPHISDPTDPHYDRLAPGETREPSQLELDTRKDNEARSLVRKAIRLLVELGYSEGEIAEFVEELYAEVVA